MPGEIVASNALLEQRAVQFRTAMNFGHVLKLFVNEFLPNPASDVPDFTEATFPGYSEWDLTGIWEPLFKIQDGEYQFTTPVRTLTATDASPETVYGWYIVGGGRVKLSGLFIDPIPIFLGTSLPMRILVQTWALSVL